MALSNGGSSPIEISQMLHSIKDDAEEKGVSMKEYLTTELGIPEEEAPLLHSAMSCLDAKGVTSSNTTAANKNTTYSNNGGITQEAVNAPVGATLTATRTPAPNQAGGRKNKRKFSRSHKKRKGSRRTRRR